MDDNQKKVLDSFVRNPTTYTIPVRDSSMLPTKIKNKKELSFIIKPPTVHVLGLAASAMRDIPDNIMDSESMDIKEALKYQDEIAKVISILSHEGSDYPEWYPEFIIKNVPSVDLLKMMQETAIKCNPGFFLNSFQIASRSNPMMMMDMRRDSTPIGS